MRMSAARSLEILQSTLAGRQVSERCARHLLDLPKGYHTAPPGAGLAESEAAGVDAAPGGAAWSGVARSRRWRFGPGAERRRRRFKSCHPACVAPRLRSRRRHRSATYRRPPCAVLGRR